MTVFKILIYPEPDDYTSLPSTLLCKIHFNIILPSTLRSSKWWTSNLPTKTQYVSLPSLISDTSPSPFRNTTRETRHDTVFLSLLLFPPSYVYISFSVVFSRTVSAHVFLLMMYWWWLWWCEHNVIYVLLVTIFSKKKKKKRKRNIIMEVNMFV